MLIKMKTSSAGPNGNRVAGKVYNVPDEEAQGLLESGSAEEIKEGEKETTTGEGRSDVERMAEGQRTNRVVGKQRKTP
jgi:hypothetical protein